MLALLSNTALTTQALKNRLTRRARRARAYNQAWSTSPTLTQIIRNDFTLSLSLGIAVAQIALMICVFFQAIT